MAGLLEKVLHKSKSRSPQELVLKTDNSMKKLSLGATDHQVEDVARNLALMKVVFFGEGDIEPSKEHAIELARQACRSNFLSQVVQKLALLDFESRKDAAQVCGAIVRMDAQGEYPGVRYIHEHPDIIPTLFAGYDNPAIALNCGSMLRDCIRDESIARLVLEGPLFADFFHKVEVTNFEVASDAFTTFKDLLTRHKALVVNFLMTRYEEFFQQYSKLLESSNYVTRRQSLKLLGELLLDRANVKVMMRYVSDAYNLRQMMLLLKDSSRSIQFEAFHVFKVFVANPNKPKPIVEILTGNQEKLLKYLTNFHTDKDDEQFKEEKVVIIKEIQALRPPTPPQ
ncbi:hypothetical protein WJX74_005590 [Apatococcus lobatus]|uniref:Uncharacterized protein n=1 Tax=Apatococcus lobatus TaxID=904363 RepID=A0AAW1QCV2_9CHLO